jgi:isopentenyl phosphate kinase
MPPKLVYLKLGGSLITDKHDERTPQRSTLRRLAREIVAGMEQRPHISLLIGHGAGSFGHIQATRHNTLAGVRSARDWHGFATVAAAVAELNGIVRTELFSAGVPVFNAQPSASARCRDGKLVKLAVEPIKGAIDNDLTPLLHGDVAFDETRGGTIISTEMIFGFLSHSLPPDEVLLAGIAPGVRSSHPRGSVIPEITPQTFPDYAAGAAISDAPDVTGGMKGKVAEMITLVQNIRGATVRIFSAEPEGALTRALSGTETTGTVIRAARTEQPPA